MTTPRNIGIRGVCPPPGRAARGVSCPKLRPAVQRSKPTDVQTVSREHVNVSICERKKELKRRRHRSKKYAQLKKKLTKATVSERTVIADKLRSLTPGAPALIEAWDLAKSSR